MREWRSTTGERSAGDVRNARWRRRDHAFAKAARGVRAAAVARAVTSSAVLVEVRYPVRANVESGQRDGANQVLRLQRAGAGAARQPVTGDRREHRLHVLGNHHRPARE